MPLKPNWLEQLLFFTTNMGPGPVMDIWAAVGYRMVLAAVRLGVFEGLAAGPATAQALAARLGTEAESTGMLLEALEALGYVRRDGATAGYANTPMTAKWMVGGKANFGAGFEFWGVNLFQLMDDLEGTIRTGRQGLNLYEWIEDQPEASRAFQDWMVAIAAFAADEIARLAPLPEGARRLLDIGGGHGGYALAYLRRQPGLTATIFDSPRALEAAEGNVREAGVGERVRLQPGNFLRDDLGSDYVVALLFYIVHGFADVQNETLVRRAAGALRPGGVLILAEQLAGWAPTPAANAIKALLGLSYRHLLGGGLPSFEAIARWMGAAGMGQVRRVESVKLPGVSLVIGQKH
jgi:SAM-dependent methyltransferase